MLNIGLPVLLEKFSVALMPCKCLLADILLEKYFTVCDVFPNVWKEEEVKIAASIRYFIAQEQTGTI